MTLTTILLQAAADQGWVNIAMMVALIAIFYFFMIRPQQKKQKEIRKAREAMQAGDKVVTAGGIYGKIKEVKETTLLIEISQGVVIKIEKGSVYPSVEAANEAKK